jgi:enoyl-[acyl-carrier protein] reductase II
VPAAQRVAAAGVDYVIAQGSEAGGHTGRIATMALVPAITAAVDVPVLAAGGVGTGRGVVAALALGAVGVWVGTRFLATRESHVHQNFKDLLLRSGSSATTVTKAYTGKTARTLANSYTRHWEGNISLLKPFPEQFMESRENFHGAMEHGDVDNGFMPTGQIVGVIDDLPPAGEVVRRLVSEARQAYAELGGRGETFLVNEGVES